MLTTGKAKSEYIEDYITIVPEEDNYKLNVNSYIGKETVNQTSSDDNLKMQVTFVDKYMDYSIYTIDIKNFTDQYLLLDTRKKTNNTYIVDEKDNKFEAFLYENKENDLILKPQEAKEIKIKFNYAYRENSKIKEICFKNMVDYQKYKQGEEVQEQFFSIEL
jgi:hypothetical protein